MNILKTTTKHKFMGLYSSINSSITKVINVLIQERIRPGLESARKQGPSLKSIQKSVQQED
jgi:hypothetical protein